jgi:serine/threonine protein kinase
LGTPDDEFLNTLEDAARDYLQTLPPATKTNFKDFFHRADDDDALDLLDQMLRLSIRDRISASEALRHPYFSYWHHGETEKIERPENPFCDPLEDQSLSIEEFKRIVFNYLQKIWRWKAANPQHPCCHGDLKMEEIDCV